MNAGGNKRNKDKARLRQEREQFLADEAAAVLGEGLGDLSVASRDGAGAEGGNEGEGGASAAAAEAAPASKASAIALRKARNKETRDARKKKGAQGDAEA